MAINFPLSPTVGQTFTIGAVIYTWDGTKWYTNVTSSAVTSVSGTAPIVSSGGTTPAISITTASTSAAGSMSAADKTKLDGIATGANNYTLPTATSTANGGIELFSDTVQSVASNAVTTTTSRTYGIQLNSVGQAVVNVPWSDTNTTYSKATSSALGLVELGSDTIQTVAANAVSTTASRSYAIQLNANDQMVVNVPWSDTNSGGTVTSVGGTGTVSGLSLSGTVTTSGSLTLAGTLAVTASNFASQTANTVLAAPNGTAGVPTFRALVAADVPTLNQNTTGTSANVTGTVAIANGGTGATSAATALSNLGAYAASNPSGYITSSSVGTGTLTLSIGSGSTNTGIVNITGTGFNANSSSNSTYQFNVGPALANLPATMTGATSGFLKKTAQDTYAIDTATYLTSYTETDPIYVASSWYSTTNNSSNWNTAYGWGNHASAGYLTSNQSISVTGDATGSGTTSIGLTLANSGVTAGTYGSTTTIPAVTVDAKGRVTSASSNTIFAGGVTKVEVVTTLPGSPNANTLYIVTG
jgi:hypothetical protein